VLPASLAVATTEIGEDIDGGPPGGAAGGSGGAITEVEEDVNGRPLGGCYRWFRWRPPPKLEKTSMAGLLGVLPAGPAVGTIDIGEDIDGGICPF
jgi:hypothetical protein